MIDVLVVGAGIAGLSAALAASRAGAKVLVIDGGAGATALSGGAWDVATTHDPFATPRMLDRALDAHRDPAHPWSRLPRALSREAILESHQALSDALSIYPPLGAHVDGALAATELGLMRRAALVQHAVLDLAPIPNARIAVAWMRALRSFDGPFLAASLNEQAVRAGDARRFVAVEVELFRRAGDVTLLPHEIAALLDAGDARRRLVTTLSRALGGASFDAVLVPPLLGLEDDRVRALVETGIELPIGEVVESLAGAQALRLARRITVALERASITRREARVARVTGSEVHLTDGTTLRAGAVVLATGKHVGGGVVSASHELREPLADLPLYARGRALPLISSARGRDPRALYGDDPFTPGAGFSLGVGWDASMRALDAHGTPRSRDLFVCGALLDGTHPSDGTGMGVAAATGWIAGTRAATS
ncbi:FAD-dependent oxidoreductase [Sandaracinus amylolyticus]|uniref:Anaerobic glycerol-3-phosphate dehydrogenase subunit B n=1 Tax=Sandaracinus amylolyticus TaxID=927083 RepID=A0A0F6SDE8_9BACT|nr:FAD-dependent oxidoreductase [Sandaracinus amylolyticus]AKF03319.1 Anaerobic glycerol-3-phosphate dehydrogenase subunit B [Sandaracinus amylolyticus]